MNDKQKSVREVHRATSIKHESGSLRQASECGIVFEQYCMLASLAICLDS